MRLVLGIAAIIMLIVVFRADVIFQSDPLLWSNQNTYYPHGLYWGGMESLGADWFISTQPPHIVFSVLVSVLQRINFVETGSFLLHFALTGVYYFAAFIIIDALVVAAKRNFFKGKKITTTAMHSLSLIILVFYIVVENATLIPRVLIDSGAQRLASSWIQLWDTEGIAGFYLLRHFAQPTTFGVFIMLGIAVAIKERWYVATLCFLVAIWFQFSYAPHVGIIMVINAGWVYTQGNKRMARNMIALFAVGVLPITIYAISLIVQGDGDSQLANEILAFTRQPHHTDPDYWWTSNLTLNIKKLGVIALSGFFVFVLGMRWLGLLLMAGFAYTMIGIVLVNATGSATLALLYPWRGTAYFVPIATVSLVAVLMARLLLPALIEGKKRYRVFYGVTVVLIFVVVLGEIDNGVVLFPTEKIETAQTRILKQAAQLTADDEVVMVPSEWESARLIIQEPIYVDWKNHPYVTDEFLEWWRRLEIAESFYEQSEAERDAICEAEQISYYIIQADTLPENAIYTDEDYALVPCGRTAQRTQAP